MNFLTPLGSVYQAGTLSGNPVSVTAGLMTLKILYKTDIYPMLEKRTKILCDGINNNLKKSKIKVTISQAGSMFTLFFESPKHYARIFHKLLKQGIYFPPSQYEACFVSVAHTQEDIERTINAFLIRS